MKLIQQLIVGMVGLCITNSMGMAMESWGTQLDQTPSDEWQWVGMPDSYCRDGSEAGFFVRYGLDSTKLLIYLEGGGACFNDQTCGLNPSRIDIDSPPQGNTQSL